MGNNKSKKKETRNRAVKKIIDISLALIIAGGAFYAIRTVTSDFSDINRISEKDDNAVVTSETEKPDENAIIYVTEVMDNETMNSGSLTVVNGQTEYKGKGDNLVSVYDVLQADGTDSYMVMDADVKLKRDAATALNDMVKAFAAETGKKDIIVDGGYRSVEYQQELYDAADDKSSAAKPGFSDYHTGYSIDLGISSEDGTMEDFTGSGDYIWFKENCSKYGFVIRFPEGKKDLTGYDYRPWHFRYVGVPHAYYMQTNNLCLEEYVEKLKNFEYTQTHLVFKGDDGNDYEVYYYPLDVSGSQTIVAVPNSEYKISGNNKDGFIISFKMNNQPAVTESSITEISDSSTKETQQSETKTTETQTSKKSEE